MGFVTNDSFMVNDKGAVKVRVLQLSFIAIASVVVFEGIVGLVTNSLAILGDAAHALFDSITTLILLVTTRIALKPPDEEHLYGHGKIEPIGGLIGGIALIGLAAFLFYEAMARIFFGAQDVIHNPLGFVAVGYTLAVDFFRIGTLWGKSGNSQTVKASFYHAFSDFASTVIALIGFGLIFIPGSDDRIDAAASIVLAFLLIYLTIGLIRSSGLELSDAIPKQVVADIRKGIQDTEGVSTCKDLKVRKVGDKTYVETTVCVSDSMDLAEAHGVASRIESNIIQSHGESVVTVHIEPIGEGKSIKKEIESTVMKAEGVREVHSVSNVFSKGKLYITLHVLVEPQLSVEEAHNIAENVEKKLRAEIPDVENVTVHAEPDVPKLSQRFAAEEEQVRQFVKQIMRRYPDIRRLNRIVTYAGENRMFINIDCSVDKSLPVEVVHDTVSHVEAEIRRKFKDSVVTIHMEPSL
jgi:cation diffusion facilitator family transporter